MRITQILENSTTSGSVATVAQPMMTQTRENINVPGLKPVKQLMRGGAKKKGPYANSIVEGKVKELHKDLKDLTSHQFQEKYKQSKSEVRDEMKKVNEDELSEQDLIVIPGQGRLRKTGFVKHDLDQGEHEGHTLKNSLHTIARAASDLDKRLSVQSEFPEWVSEKIGAAKGMMVTVMDYLISSQEMQHDTDAMEGSENKYSNLSNRGVNRGINRAGDDFNRMLDLDQAESPHYKTQHQQDTKQRLKTKPMAGPKGVLPEGSQRVDSLVTDALRVMKGPEVSDAVLALKRVLGDRAYNERRGFYSFYVDQIHDMYGQQGVAEDKGMSGYNKFKKEWRAKHGDTKPVPGYDSKEYTQHIYQQNDKKQGVAEGELEEDLSRRGFLRGLGAATLGATALGAASKAQAGQDLGNGFVLTTVDVFGGKFKAVLDTQSDIHYLPNRNESGGAIVRSMAPFIMIKNGQTNTAMNVGPAVQAALKKAGLLKGVEESVAKGKIDFAKKLQGKVDKHNKAVVQTKKDIGSRVADIGAGGKEYNVKTDAAWDAAKKKVAEGASAKVR